MRKGLLTTLILLGISSILHCQKLYTEAYECYKTDSTKAFSNLALFLEEASGEDLGKGQFLLGYIRQYYGHENQAIHHYYEALKYYPRNEIAGDIYNKIGSLFLQAGSPDNALSYFEEARNIWGKDNLSKQSIAYLKIGQCQMFMDNWTKAHESLERALHLAIESGSKKRTFEALKSLGILNFEQGYFHRSIKNYNDALIYASNRNDSATILNNKGNSLLSLNSLDSAQALLDGSISMRSETNQDLLTPYYNLARVALANSDTALSISYLENSVAGNRLHRLHQGMRQSYELLKELLYKKGEIEKYVAYSREFDHLMFENVEEFESLERTVDLLQMARTEEKISYEMARNRDFWLKVLSWSIGLTTAIVLLGYIFYRRRQLQQMADVSENLVPEGHEHLKTVIRILKLSNREYKRNYDELKDLHANKKS